MADELNVLNLARTGHAYRAFAYHKGKEFIGSSTVSFEDAAAKVRADVLRYEDQAK